MISLLAFSNYSYQYFSRNSLLPSNTSEDIYFLQNTSVSCRKNSHSKISRPQLSAIQKWTQLTFSGRSRCRLLLLRSASLLGLIHRFGLLRTKWTQGFRRRSNLDGLPARRRSAMWNDRRREQRSRSELPWQPANQAGYSTECERRWRGARSGDNRGHSERENDGENEEGNEKVQKNEDTEKLSEQEKEERKKEKRSKKGRISKKDDENDEEDMKGGGKDWSKIRFFTIECYMEINFDVNIFASSERSFCLFRTLTFRLRKV